MNKLNFHFLNVGKGNCSIIDFPSGNLTIFDIDDSRSVSVAEKFIAENVKKYAKITDPINYIDNNFMGRDIFRFILSHPDMDHMSGIKRLFDIKDVVNFWDTENIKRIDPDSWNSSPYNEEDWYFYQSIRESRNNTTTLNLYRNASGLYWTQDGIEILSPTIDLVIDANAKEDFDNLSYVLMVKYSGKKILLCGDATQEALQDIINHYSPEYLKCDVLLAPNHGSPNHISNEILDVFNPDLTIVSVALGVEYARALYSKYGIVLSTKHYGNIMLSISNNGSINFITETGKYSDKTYNLFDLKLNDLFSKLMSRVRS